MGGVLLQSPHRVVMQSKHQVKTTADWWPLSVVSSWTEYIDGAETTIVLDEQVYPAIQPGRVIQNNWYPDRPWANYLNEDAGMVSEDASGTGRWIGGWFPGPGPQFIFSEYTQGSAEHYPICLVRRIYGHPTGTLCQYPFIGEYGLRCARAERSCFQKV